MRWYFLKHTEHLKWEDVFWKTLYIFILFNDSNDKFLNKKLNLAFEKFLIQEYLFIYYFW